MGITQELTGYCSRMKFNDLSDEVIDCAKYRFLDFISVACRDRKRILPKRFIGLSRRWTRGRE